MYCPACGEVLVDGLCPKCVILDEDMYVVINDKKPNKKEVISFVFCFLSLGVVHFMTTISCIIGIVLAFVSVGTAYFVRRKGNQSFFILAIILSIVAVIFALAGLLYINLI